MKIELYPEKDFPFGQNIHFAYDTQADELIFLNKSLYWACPPSEHSSPIQAIVSRIQPEELPILYKASQELIAGEAQGSITSAQKSCPTTRVTSP